MVWGFPDTCRTAESQGCLRISAGKGSGASEWKAGGREFFFWADAVCPGVVHDVGVSVVGICEAWRVRAAAK